MKSIILVFIFLFTSISKPMQENRSNIGLVPDAVTAIKIAEAIWLAKYGKDIKEKKPFVATLENDSVWLVKGTLKKGWKGGVPHASILKSDGRIYNVYHDK